MPDHTVPHNYIAPLPSPTYTHDLPHSSCTHDLPHSSCTHDLPHSSCTHNLPHPSCTHDLPNPTCTHDLPHPSCTHDLPHPSCTHNLPHPSCTHDLLNPTCTHDLPHPSCTHDLPHPSCTHDLPNPTCIHDLPHPSCYQNSPHPLSWHSSFHPPTSISINQAPTTNVSQASPTTGTPTSPQVSSPKLCPSDQDEYPLKVIYKKSCRFSRYNHNKHKQRPNKVKNNDHCINLSSCTLTKEETSILSKGLGFVPTPPVPHLSNQPLPHPISPTTSQTSACNNSPELFSPTLSIMPCMPRTSSVRSINRSPTHSSNPVNVPTSDVPQNQPFPSPQNPTTSLTPSFSNSLELFSPTPTVH